MEIATSAAILEAITTRQSVSPKHLGSPGPTKDEIRRMVTAAVTAPDHGALRPWRFLLIADEARPHLADLFVAAKADKTPDMTPDMVEKERDKALCGPTLIAVTARINQRHPKVPASEQYASVGMAVQICSWPQMLSVTAASCSAATGCGTTPSATPSLSMPTTN